MIKRLFSDAFDETHDRLRKRWTPEKIIGILWVVVLALYLGIGLFVTADKTPATFDDYNELNERLLAVSESPENLLFGDGDISIRGDTIKYTVKNDQCEMTGKYDSEFNLVEKTQKDKSTGPVEAFFISLISFVVAVVCGWIVYWCLMAVVTFIVEIFIVLNEHEKDWIIPEENKTGESL